MPALGDTAIALWASRMIDWGQDCSSRVKLANEAWPK